MPTLKRLGIRTARLRSKEKLAEYLGVMMLILYLPRLLMGDDPEKLDSHTKQSKRSSRSGCTVLVRLRSYFIWWKDTQWDSISYLRPFYSWSRLELSQACASQLLRDLKVFPDFLKYLRAFGQKNFARDEGFSGCNFSISRDKAGAVERIGTVSSNFLSNS